MKKSTLLFIFLIFFSISLFSQNAERPEYRPVQFFVGIQPAGNIYPYDEYRNVFDINIVPFQLEYALNQRWSIRLSPSIFRIFVPEHQSEFSRAGLGVSVPYHFSKKNSEEGHRGFYLGPHAAMNKHRLDNYTSVTGAAEAGYYFLLGSKFSINIGAQIGRTYRIDPLNPYVQIENHRGAVFAFGIWF